MSNDQKAQEIIERLRESPDLQHAAADTIERLLRELAEARNSAATARADGIKEAAAWAALKAAHYGRQPHDPFRNGEIYLEVARAILKLLDPVEIKPAIQSSSSYNWPDGPCTNSGWRPY